MWRDSPHGSFVVILKTQGGWPVFLTLLVAIFEVCFWNLFIMLLFMDVRIVDVCRTQTHAILQGLFDMGPFGSESSSMLVSGGPTIMLEFRMLTCGTSAIFLSPCPGQTRKSSPVRAKITQRRPLYSVRWKKCEVMKG